MAVRTQDQRIAKESAIVTRARLRKQRGAIERWTALVVLFVSFLGTIVALAGGWPTFLAGWRILQPAWVRLLVGLLFRDY